MPPQIKRLIPLFAIFIGLFLVIRHLLVPESFGELGHYRALSLEENAAVEITFSGTDACLECHQDIADMKGTDLHDIVSCETCHGPGKAHVDLPDSVDVIVPTEREFCGLCHALNYARPKGSVNQVDLMKHNVDKKCIDCHNPHMPWDLKNQTPQEESF